MKTTVRAVALSNCQKVFSEKWLWESHLCAGGAGDGCDTCVGDAGGPLGYPVRYNGVRFVQFGVTSFGKNCGRYPAVYTNVAHFVHWIFANMEA